MLYIDAVIRANLPKAVTKEHMLKATLEDETLTVLKELISQGYISKEQKRKLASYAHIFPELSVVDGLVLRGCRIVVPASLWQSVTTLAHEGHQGVVRTKQYLRMHFWFPGLDKNAWHARQIPIFISKSHSSQQNYPQNHGLNLQQTYIVH